MTLMAATREWLATLPGVRRSAIRREAEERIRFMASCDTLTGLANRSVFKTRLDSEAADAALGRMCAVLFLDLDCFKEINDMFGHNAGDVVLIEAAQRIGALLGPHEIAGRMGGDEFAVILHVASATEAQERADAIVEVLSQPVGIEGATISSGASIGVALCPVHARDGDGLLRAADMALYDAKSAGRGRSRMFDTELERRLGERRSLEADLRQALGRGELEVQYQPLHDIASRRAIGYEALLRWHHPQRGPVAPSDFIPIAEETGLIVPIGEWVLREALAEAARWPEDLTLAVNVSPAQLQGDALTRQVVGALAMSGVAPRRLELEITETLLMHDSESHRRLLHQLRGIGVRIALDDFGTGYSSLNYLRSFPFDKLKIDRSFVIDLAESADSRAIVTTVLALARRFRMETIAEGVEDEAQLAALAEMGCQQAQGFLFSKAVPAAQLPFERQQLSAVRRLAVETAQLPQSRPEDARKIRRRRAG